MTCSVMSSTSSRVARRPQLTVVTWTFKVASRQGWSIERTEIELTTRASAQLAQRVRPLAKKGEDRGWGWKEYLGLALTALSLLVGLIAAELPFLAWQDPQPVQAA